MSKGDTVKAILMFNGAKSARILERNGALWFQSWNGARWNSALTQSTKTMEQYKDSGFEVIPSALIRFMRKS